MTKLNLTGPGGKLPPQAVELEEAVLGALMTDKDAILQVASTISPETFYKPAHTEIYQAIYNLYVRMDAIDMLTVTQELRRMGKIDMVGGAVYVMRLTNRISSAAHIETHTKQLVELQIKRELISWASKIMDSAFEDETDAFDNLTEADKALGKVSSLISGNKTKSMLAYSRDLLAYLESDAEVMLAESGIAKLDNLLGGIIGGDFVMIAGRPAMGKTAVSTFMARHMAMQGINVGFVSLEMTGVQVSARNALSEFYSRNLEGTYGYPTVSRMRLKRVSKREVEGLSISLSQSVYLDNIQIEEEGGLSFMQIATRAREWKRKYNIKVLFVDYLQLITLPTSKSETTARQLELLCNAFKNLAKELDIAIIALSQLSRKVEERGGDKKPILSDLRESGGLEQAADAVVFLYRPEYYGFMKDEHGNSTEGRLDFIVAKGRNGGTGTVSALINLERNIIKDWGGFAGEIAVKAEAVKAGEEALPF